MNDRGDRCPRARANVRGGPRDGARSRDAADKRTKDIRDALPDQFLVGIMTCVGHAVGDHRGEQRFNRAESGDGEGRSHQVAQSSSETPGN